MDEVKISHKKTEQKQVDENIVKQIKAVPFMLKYISSKFTITNAVKPHEIKF